MKKTILLILFAIGFSYPSLVKAQEPFVGEIMFVPYDYAPVGWHDCDGALLSIAENDALFALIGTTYGGDGLTTFGLPNAQGRVIIDDGQGSGLSNYQLGQSGGTETVTLTANQIPAHGHNIAAVASAGSQNSPTGGIPANTKVLDKEYASTVTAADKVNMKSTMLSSAGGNQPHNNMMPTLSLKCIISLYGIFPSP